MLFFSAFKRNKQAKQVAKAKAKAQCLVSDTDELLDEALRLAARRKVVIRRRIQE